MQKFEFMHNVKNNIDRYYAEETSVCECMGASVDELVRYAVASIAHDARSRNFFTTDAFTEKILYTPIFGAQEDNVISENRTLVSAVLAANRGAFLADFCRKTALALKSTLHMRVSPALFTERSGAAPSGGGVSYVDSEVFRQAYQTFAKKDTLLKANPVQSFADACDDTASGESEYCILPIENSRDGALPTFLNMIERYELFIVKICEITNDEGITTKFSLICRDTNGIIDINGAHNITLRLSGGGEMLSQLFAALPVLGVSLVNAVFVPRTYSDGYAHICTFCGGSESLFALLMLLGIIKADYTLCGIFDTVRE